MKHVILFLFVFGLISFSEAQQPAQPEKVAKVSEKKWLDESRGYAEALELQKQTGADLLVYFAQYSPPDRKGLSTWFERKSLQHGLVVEGLKPYIKVKVMLPLDKKEVPVFEKLKVTGGPTLVVVQTNGWSYRVGPFDWPGGQPELKKPEALIEEIRSHSGLRYQKPASE
jgi:hypothetical protein